MNRFFVNPNAIDNNRVLFDAQQSHQIRHVLRLRSGAEVVVLDDQGWQYRVRMENTEDSEVTGWIVQRQRAGGEPAMDLILFQGSLKRDKFEWVLQKGTEVGIAGFVPVVTQRSLVRKIEMKDSRLIRWQSIVREAAEQCGRGRIPRIQVPISWEQSFQQSEDYALRLLASTEADAIPIVQALQGPVPVGKRVALWIGPEGGFSDAELATARRASIIPVSLGPRILRTETAAVVGATLWLYQWGQFTPQPD